ncbi:MAG: serine/threonine-protein kinase, partial [Kofleriaceae bacterium]
MIVDPSAATAAEQGRRSVAAAGESLGKYRLDRVLGAGGMGIVWAAFDPDLERAVALKLLHSSDVPTLRSRLLREARAMARLKHPNVLTVYEVGTDQNRDYIAMEIVDGETLDSWLDSKPAQDEIVGALVAAGRGLMAAHAAGLIHRDFKPHNVLRSKEGHVYVTDFGLARGQIEDGAELEQIAVADSRAIDVLVSPLTQTGVMIGTPAYMAPEQFAGRTPDARTDQFAFCVTAWEALSGARPFRGESLPELERAASGGARELTSTLPPRIRDVLARGLEASPDARWPDLKSLLAALEAAIVPPKPESRWGLVAIIAGGALVAG